MSASGVTPNAHTSAVRRPDALTATWDADASAHRSGRPSPLPPRLPRPLAIGASTMPAPTERPAVVGDNLPAAGTPTRLLMDTHSLPAAASTFAPTTVATSTATGPHPTVVPGTQAAAAVVADVASSPAPTPPLPRSPEAVVTVTVTL